MTEDWQNGGFGLYIHWPFCEAKCPYCDFNSHVTKWIDQDAWCAAYLREIARVGAQTPNRVLKSVFFGGGTPSLMAPSTVEAILSAVAATWTLANDVEITLEANPSSVEAHRFRAYADAGVNRVSLGVQALNDADLKRLGRLHSVAEAQTAFDIARANFDRVSFDLIYARQDQTLADWEAELSMALTLAVDHLSLYQLTIENGTAFGDRYAAGKLKGLPNEDISADMYELTQDLCSAHGLPAYEVSNHARPGSESRHNLIYWNYGDYAGIGPGAHGRLTIDGRKYATVAPKSPGAWLTRSKETQAVDYEPVTSHDMGGEYLMMGLRVLDGIDMDRVERLAGAALNQDAVARLVELGLVHQTDRQLRASDRGRLVLNSVIAELLPD